MDPGYRSTMAASLGKPWDSFKKHFADLASILLKPENQDEYTLGDNLLRLRTFFCGWMGTPATDKTAIDEVLSLKHGT